MPRASAGPLPGPHQPRLHRRPQAAASSTSWAGTCVATGGLYTNSASTCVVACRSSSRLHHRATSAACLPTWHRMHRWPGRVSKRGGAATDGTGLAPVPDKARGHLSYALNASCPVIRAISSGHCTPFHLLCATVAAPFDYKRRPMAYWRRIRLFRTTHSPQLVRELKNSLKYTHQSRTRVLRILAARTWVNDPCDNY